MINFFYNMPPKNKNKISRQELSLNDLMGELKRLRNSSKTIVLQRFFKTGLGQYGEGDIFWGLNVPDCRRLAKKYAALKMTDVLVLLKSEIHEIRLTALLIIVEHYQRAEKIEEKRKIVNIYLKNSRYINNWDLVDLSVYKILGDYLLYSKKERNILDKLVVSKNLWERRLAMVATYAFIKAGQEDMAYQVAEKLLDDKHDLMHKAVGWMLREAGKRGDIAKLHQFINKHIKDLPRTTLRYAIERFPERERQAYLKK